MIVKQIVNLKKVVVDSDLKVSLTLEFIAADRAGKERVFELIKMQGEVLEASFDFDTSRHASSGPRYQTKQEVTAHAVASFLLDCAKNVLIRKRTGQGTSPLCLLLLPCWRSLILMPLCRVG